MTTERGAFIVLEGIDGCGKSTQAALLCLWLETLLGATRVLRTFEPGDWEGGATLRQLLLNGVALENRTELLLFLADRSGHVDARIVPALHSGRWVVCERYTDSTLAYQSWGRQAPLEGIRPLLDWCRFPSPDLTVLLDIDPETASSRLCARGGRDRIESADNGFMRRVAHGYRELAAQNPGRAVVVDASLETDRVAALVKEAVLARLFSPQARAEKTR